MSVSVEPDAVMSLATGNAREGGTKERGERHTSRGGGVRFVYPGSAYSSCSYVQSIRSTGRRAFVQLLHGYLKGSEKKSLS